LELGVRGKRLEEESDKKAAAKRKGYVKKKRKENYLQLYKKTPFAEYWKKKNKVALQEYGQLRVRCLCRIEK